MLYEQARLESVEGLVMLIYKVRNTVNGKVYVGQTSKSVDRRWWEHRCRARLGEDKVLYNALRKYGEERFAVSVLCLCDSKEELDEMEYHYIKQFNSFKDLSGYNMTYGGEGAYGYRHSAGTRNRMSAIRVSKDLIGSRNANFGNHWSAEQRESLSVKNRGRLVGESNPSKRPDVRKKLRDTKLGIRNPNAMCWRLCSPTGEVFTFFGGIKRELKNLGLDYQTLWSKYRGNQNGWILTQEGGNS